eukprot:TRINITY_DN13455_c0_g1_i1.p1 TRINITY_DN13455_c0_g1~~TRINITY_DN13455_c0_g1_i1.p1  ORF type:complete len:981 (-),score=219.43 TRINITY_DN13455_c0_g1_i1:51-2882(-)
MADTLLPPAELGNTPVLDSLPDDEDGVAAASASGAAASGAAAALGSTAVSPETPSGGANAPLSAAEERRQVLELEDQERISGFEAGNNYFLIDQKWYIEWLQWVGHHSAQSPKHGPMPEPGSPSGAQLLQRSRSWTKDRPGPIDNSSLLEDPDSGELKRGILEHEDYRILSEAVWNLLHGWYHGGPPIKRRAIEQSGRVIVEIYGLTLKVHTAVDSSKPPTVMMESKTTTVGAFKRRACQELNLDPEKVRIWDYYNKRKYGKLENQLESSLEDCRICEPNDILLEQQLPDGSWPKEETIRTGGYSMGGSLEDVPTIGTPVQRGAIGLSNLGNTCFMNSSIQCLSNVPQLREFFVSGSYKDELNNNAFKTKGKLAETFSSLLSHMWRPDTVQVAPRNFKWQIGQFAEQFIGYRQHDSMEFIEYVLDGLKEDVNRVTGSKPFVELKEADGRPDEVVAKEARDNYMLRNSSFVDELFLGFFKSTVSCPEAGCGRVSVKFDPYLSVKLPLSSAVEDRMVVYDVTVVPRDAGPDAIRSYKCSVQKFGNAGDIIEAAARQAGLEAKDCVLAEIYAKKIYKFFELNDSVDGIRSGDVLALYALEDAAKFSMTPEQRWGGFSSTLYTHDEQTETTDAATAGSDDVCSAVIHQRRWKASLYSYPASRDLVGIPVVLTLAKRLDAAELIEVVRTELERRLGQFPEGWKLFWTTEKHHIEDCSTEVQPSEGVVSLTGGQYIYLVVEFPEGTEAPETLTRLQEQLSGTPISSGLGQRGGASIELEKCLKMFTETDKLSAMDAWYCNKCKDHREAFKKMEFWSLPPVLVLQLKRFTYTQYSRERLDTAVVFPLEGLDMAPYAINEDGSPRVYDLIAVSIHMGGLGSGHYVAYARSSEDGDWYYFDDSQVTKVDASRVAGETVGSYVLFYLRRDFRPEKWGAPETGAPGSPSTKRHF